jgi:hypothetical protein
LAASLIDGDGYIFSADYLRDGKAGGQRAASFLSQELTAALGRRMQHYVAVYVNRAGLSETLVAHGFIHKQSQFDDFIVGFNQSSPLFSIIDAGKGKEAADAKVKG